MSEVAITPGRHRMRVATIAAVGVVVVLFVQDVISAIVTVVVGYTIAGDYAADLLRIFGYSIVVVLAFAVGVWLSLWRLGPVLRESAVTTVVVRSLLAAGLGAVLVFVVNLGLGLTRPLSGTGSLLGYSFPELNWGGIGQAVTMAFQSGIAAFVQQGPIVVLVVLLVWIWLSRHPSPAGVSTASDEV